jgi:predicted enzyme related to lactoylglutathione lyase
MGSAPLSFARPRNRPAANFKRGEQMDPVVHFELPAEDRERMAAFYSAAFGWDCELLGPEMGNYTVVKTAESQGSRSIAPGAINGGFFMRTDDPASHAPSVVVGVSDIHAALAAVEQAGGTVAGPPQEIPGVGLYGSFHDTEGNRMSLLQPLPPAAA